jgi:proteasome lid subunit RPN8/RPN11
MSVEAGVLIAKDGGVIHWHLPAERSAGYLPDSQDLWEVIMTNRDNVLGFAHSHPGSGKPGPSMEDLTTFSAIEKALGRKLIWWITSADQLVEVELVGPGKYDYETVLEETPPEWLGQLRKHSYYEHRMVRRWSVAPPQEIQQELAEPEPKLGEPDNGRN